VHGRLETKITHHIALEAKRARRETEKYVIIVNCKKYFVLHKMRIRDNSVGIATG
jgi:hypothetical protein